MVKSEILSLTHEAIMVACGEGLSRPLAARRSALNLPQGWEMLSQGRTVWTQGIHGWISVSLLSSPTCCCFDLKHKRSFSFMQPACSSACLSRRPDSSSSNPTPACWKSLTCEAKIKLRADLVCHTWAVRRGEDDPRMATNLLLVGRSVAAHTPLTLCYCCISELPGVKSSETEEK